MEKYNTWIFQVIVKDKQNNPNTMKGEIYKCKVSIMALQNIIH